MWIGSKMSKMPSQKTFYRANFRVLLQTLNSEHPSFGTVHQLVDSIVKLVFSFKLTTLRSGPKTRESRRVVLTVDGVIHHLMYNTYHR